MAGIGRGILGGIVATAVMSGLMLMKSAMGLMPQRDVIQMLSMMLGMSLAIAWAMHFAIGATWGGLYAVGYRLIPGGGRGHRGRWRGLARSSVPACGMRCKRGC